MIEKSGFEYLLPLIINFYTFCREKTLVKFPAVEMLKEKEGGSVLSKKYMK